MQDAIRNLVLSPHVDDETLGCFSFLGPQTQVLWFGVEVFRELSREERLVEARAVAEQAGFHHALLHFEVNRYECAGLIGSIEEWITRLKPHTVLLPRASYNQDHRSVFEAGLTATRPHDRLPMVPRVLVYDQVHATLWPREDGFRAQYFRPIDMEAKLQLWQLHSSQQRDHRSERHLRVHGELRGQQAGVPYAEAFEVKRWVE